MNDDRTGLDLHQVSRESHPDFTKLGPVERIHIIHRPNHIWLRDGLTLERISGSLNTHVVTEHLAALYRNPIHVLIGFSCDPITPTIMRRYGISAYTCDQLPRRQLGDSRWSEAPTQDELAGYPSDYHINADLNTEHKLLHDSLYWNFGIFHPPCTYLTTSGAWAFKDGPYHQRIKPGTLVGAARRKARDEALELVSNLLNMPFPTVVENPAKSYICSSIAKPSQIIHPYQFGHDAAKATGLWFSKNVPRLIGTTRIRGSYIRGREVFANQTDKGQNRMAEDEDRWRQRSITYPGIAEAMGHQYAQWLLRSRGMTPIYFVPAQT